MLEATVHARAALAGNPSDGYGGRVTALPITGLSATVAATASERVSLIVDGQGSREFDSIEAALAADASCDGPGLLHAALKRAAATGADIGSGVELRARTEIPTEVGLASSSALVIATLRALEAPLERDALARTALAVETDELGIAAGLQDRLVQVYDTLVHMDFAAGTCDVVDGAPPAFVVAWQDGASASSDGLHSDLLTRFHSGEPAVVSGMRELALQADAARDAIVAGDADALGAAMDASFAIRVAIGATDQATIAMARVARAAGGSANSAGSGGAIVATAEDLVLLERALSKAGCDTLRTG